MINITYNIKFGKSKSVRTAIDQACAVKPSNTIYYNVRVPTKLQVASSGEFLSLMRNQIYVNGLYLLKGIY